MADTDIVTGIFQIGSREEGYQPWVSIEMNEEILYIIDVNQRVSKTH